LAGELSGPTRRTLRSGTSLSTGAERYAFPAPNVFT
jgi:hypothetical protein